MHTISSVVANDGTVIFFCSECGTETFEEPCDRTPAEFDPADALAIELGLFSVRPFSYHAAMGAALDAA
jgi:hypothetical protein